MTARALMIQGTGSNVGKSVIVAGLCRLARRRGIRVAPFKPQNMSNNAAVCADGGEIGRAQALQARAAGLEPHRDFNPVLLKPHSDRRSQVVVQGRVVGTLRPDDIANMGFARAAGVPVCLVGDIDRGGVIAALVGTRAVLDPEDAALIVGFAVNKFRGDPALFADGLASIERRTGWPCFGLIHWLPAAGRLPSEDTASISSNNCSARAADRPLRIVAPTLARLANFDDADPLRSRTTHGGGRGSPAPAPRPMRPGATGTWSTARWTTSRRTCPRCSTPMRCSRRRALPPCDGGRPESPLRRGSAGAGEQLQERVHALVQSASMRPPSSAREASMR